MIQTAAQQKRHFSRLAFQKAPLHLRWITVYQHQQLPRYPILHPTSLLCCNSRLGVANPVRFPMSPLQISYVNPGFRLVKDDLCIRLLLPRSHFVKYCTRMGIQRQFYHSGGRRLQLRRNSKLTCREICVFTGEFAKQLQPGCGLYH